MQRFGLVVQADRDQRQGVGGGVTLRTQLAQPLQNLPGFIFPARDGIDATEISKWHGIISQGSCFFTLRYSFRNFSLKLQDLSVTLLRGIEGAVHLDRFPKLRARFIETA